MAAPTTGPCGPWLNDLADITACCPGIVPVPDPAILQQALDFATEILFRASGRQYPGLCDRVVKPCSSTSNGCNGWGAWSDLGWTFWYWDNVASNWFSAFPISGSGSFFPFCGCSGRCNLPYVILPAPIAEVTELVIDGVIIDPSAYDVVNYRQLRRIDGGSLPCTNDFTLDSAPGGDVGTWQITYTYGRGPGTGGEIAVARYACELAKLWCNAADENCRLPYRIQNIVREGMSMSFIDPSLFLKQGMTGIPEVDQWVQSVNPNALSRRATAQRLGVPSTNFRSAT